jgi:hypothetical protein
MAGDYPGTELHQGAWISHPAFCGRIANPAYKLSCRGNTFGTVTKFDDLDWPSRQCRENPLQGSQCFTLFMDLITPFFFQTANPATQ